MDDKENRCTTEINHSQSTTVSNVLFLEVEFIYKDGLLSMMHMQDSHIYNKYSFKYSD